MSAVSHDEFDRWPERYGPTLSRFCMKTCRNRQDAEDLEQDTWRLACEHLAAFKNRCLPSTWLISIAIRCWIRTLEGRGRPPMRLEEWTPGCGPDPATLAVRHMELAGALDALSDPLYEALLLVHLYGLSCAEAGARLGIPAGTVKSRVHNAIKRLRARLEVAGGGVAFYWRQNT